MEKVETLETWKMEAWSIVKTENENWKPDKIEKNEK